MNALLKLELGRGSSGISNDWCIKKQILEEFITVIQYFITQIVNKCFSLSQHGSRWGYVRVSPFALCPAYPPVLQAIYIITIGNFRYVEIQLDSEARTQTEVINKQSFNFLCLCPLSLAAVLNSNISKVVYCLYLTGKETQIFVRGALSVLRSEQFSESEAQEKLIVLDWDLRYK